MGHGDGHSWLKWVGHFGKMSYCFWEIFLKNTSLQGSTLSGHCMSTKERGWTRRKGEAKGEELPRKGNTFMSLTMGGKFSASGTFETSAFA